MLSGMDPAYEKHGSTPPLGDLSTASRSGIDHVGGFPLLDVQLVSIGRDKAAPNTSWPQE